jgi:hypothetical protein
MNEQAKTHPKLADFKFCAVFFASIMMLRRNIRKGDRF